MAGRKEEIDLPIALHNPRNARKYIAAFDWALPDPPPFIIVNFDQKIWLNNMTDDEAVTVALVIYHDMEIPAAKRDKNLEMWEH